MNKGIRKRRLHLRLKAYCYSERTKYKIKILRVFPITHFPYPFMDFFNLTVINDVFLYSFILYSSMYSKTH